MDSYLDLISNAVPLVRRNWVDKPDLPDDMYYYSPTCGVSGLLLHNYEESDKSFRERYKLLVNK